MIKIKYLVYLNYSFFASKKAKLGLLFIYISTDYVFDGTKPPYKIDDEPNPLNKYGISKLFGETVTKNASPSIISFEIMSISQ